MIGQIIRSNASAYRIARRIVGRWRHFRYGLRSVHPTFYLGLGGRISKDLIADAYSFVGPECLIGPKVEIGAYTMFGPRVCVVGDDHRTDIVGTAMYFSGRPDLKTTRIGRDVWVGANVTIMAGTTIGDGAIVAAGSVVTKDVPPFEIHGGVPNRKLRDRFETESDVLRHRAFLELPPKEGTYCEWRF